MASDWTLESFCAAQTPIDVSSFAESHISSFLQGLFQYGVTTVHPFCQNYLNDTTASTSYFLPDIPRQGPLLHQDHLETWKDIVVTTIAMGIPEVMALAELWLRLFASLLAPVGLLRMLQEQLLSSQPDNYHKKQQQQPSEYYLHASVFLSVAASVVLFTDTFYVMEYGYIYGASFLLATTVAALRICLRRRWYYTAGYVTACVAVAFSLYHHSQRRLPDSIQPTHVQEGLYYDITNPFTHKLVTQHWRNSDYNYTATPWMPTGDSRTGLPFLINNKAVVNSVPQKDIHRVWLESSVDAEVVALDIVFPKKKQSNHYYLDTSQPIYLVLHGLNGGSQEEYVRDFCQRRQAEGATCVIMIARGLMDLPVRGWNVFHGARWTDVRDAALVLKQAVVDSLEPTPTVAGVGFSMGAIILSNYVARSGKDCALDAAVAISGGLDLRFEMNFARAQRLWQPMLTGELRGAFVVGKWGERLRARVTKEELKSLMRATHISELDEIAVVAYNPEFDNLTHYYAEMSALGDIPLGEYHSEKLMPNRRIHDVSIPFLVLHALDDPLVTWQTVGSNRGWMHPANLTKTGSGNLLVLLTKQGGHVGWPVGWLPFLNNWKYMNDVAMTFVRAVSSSMNEKQ